MIATAIREKIALKVDLSKLPETVVAPRTDPIYNCHAYLTKIPIAAIQPFIATFTAPGETVVDLFAGSGMTGLAAAKMGRQAHLSDISVLGQHIATGYVTSVSAEDLSAAADKVVAAARKAIGNLYLTKRASDGLSVEMIRTIWSFTYVCPSCSTKLVYFHHLTGDGAPPKSCPSCAAHFARRNWQRSEDVPVAVVVPGSSRKQVEQPLDAVDMVAIAAAAQDPRQNKVPSLAIEKSREMFSRSGLGKTGLTETAHFFSPRNAVTLFELWQSIQNIQDEQLRKKLSFAFTAILARASRRYQWSAKRPLNAQNQTYYIAPVYFEWNVFDLFLRKVKAAIRADQELFGDSPLFQHVNSQNVTYEIASADNLSHISESSVDYVFTDPPFGSNIYYSDMNLFHEAWLGATTDASSEAVIHTTGKRRSTSGERYEALLRRAFSEAFRILKPGRYMSVVFGNSNGRIWSLVQRAIRDAGFEITPIHVAILDKGQRSVKGLNSGSEGVVTVDLVLTVQKPQAVQNLQSLHLLNENELSCFIKSAVEECLKNDLPNPSHVYAYILKSAIKQNFLLDNLHLSDVLLSLRSLGYSINQKTGLFHRSKKHELGDNNYKKEEPRAALTS